MTNTFKKTTFFLLCITLLAAVSIASIFSERGSGIAKTEEIALTSSSIASSYKYRSEVSFPESVQFEYEGSTVTADSGVLYKPDGVVLNMGKSVVLDTVGIYTAKYFFNHNASRIAAAKSFSVAKSYFTLTPDGEGSVVPSDESNDATKLKLKEKKDGLIVTLNDGTEFLYNEPVDLRKSVGGDGISEILTIDPKLGHDFDSTKTPGSITAESVTIRLTDCYNPERFVEILMWFTYSQQEKGNPYYRVSTDSQTSVGCQVEPSKPAGTASKEIYIDETRYLAWYDRYGTGGKYALRDDLKQHDGWTWKYNLENNRVYFSVGAHNNLLVTDLSSADIYGNNLFGGFTTGEVFVSISAQQYYQSQIRFDLISIGNHDGAALKALASEYMDVTEPEIIVENIEGDTIYAMAGDEVTIPAAKALDVNLKGNVNAKVFRSYGLPKQINESTKNGKFTLAIEDRYFIEYSAYDTFGNKGTKVITVLPVRPEEIDDTGKLVINKSIVFYADKITQLIAGNRAAVQNYSVRSLNGQQCTVDATVLLGDKQIELINDSFVPQATGEYTIRYRISDGIFTYEASYTVNCISDNVVSFYGDVRAPRYFIKGSTYELETMTAYTFGNTPTVTEVKTHVKYGGGDFAEIDPKNFTVTGDGSAQIKFTASGAEDVVMEPIPIVDTHDAGSLKINRFFVGDFVCKEKETAINDKGQPVTITINEVVYESQVKSGQNKLEFINEIIHRNFYIEFRIPQLKSEYTSLTFSLTDIFNPSKKLDFKITNEDSRVYLAIGGGARTRITDAMFGSAGVFSIRLDASIGRVTFNNNHFFAYDADFDSEFCYLDIELGGIYGDAAVRVDQINTQRFTNVITRDNGTPEIYMPMENGYKAPESIVTIYAPIVGDVLSPMRAEWISLSVMSGGAALKSIDGVLLDGSQDKTRSYQVKLGGDGQVITVSYSACDAANNNTAVLNYKISVVENEPPIITFTDGYKETSVVSVKAGAKHKVRFNVTDNVSSKEELTVRINLFSHKTQKLTAIDGDTLLIKDEGRYVVYVYAYDKAGNSTIRSYRIKIIK